METLFSISKTAKKVNMTTETLRHYDRIGLVHPCKTDEWTGYRYYSEKEIIRLHTVHALRCMEIPLKEIKKIIELDNLEEIVKFLTEAMVRADEKIAELHDAKSRIERAKTYYEGKTDASARAEQNTILRTLPKRTILLSDTLQEPSIDNLWDYHRHFYAQIGAEEKDKFAFEDLAGIYEREGSVRMFAQCSKYLPIDGLTDLPAGRYLCAECTEAEYGVVVKKLSEEVRKGYGVEPAFIVRIVVLTGILQWKYEVQILVEELPH